MEEEIRAWSDVELNALLIQDICGALMDLGINLDTLCDMGVRHVNDAILQCSGNDSGRIYITDDLEVYCDFCQ